MPPTQQFRPIRRAVHFLLSDVPQRDDDSAQQISINEFREQAKSGDLKRIFVQQYPNGFALFSERKSTRQLYVIRTARGPIRNWPTLNSLLMFLHRHEAPIAEFTVRLNKTNPTKAPDYESQI